MYEKIAKLLNEFLGYEKDYAGEVTAEDVENYLRFGNVDYLEEEEAKFIDAALENLL